MINKISRYIGFAAVGMLMVDVGDYIVSSNYPVAILCAIAGFFIFHMEMGSSNKKKDSINGS